MSSSGQSTQNPCGSPPPNPFDGETRLPCKSATVSSSTPKDSYLPSPTNLGITNCCSRLETAPREAVEARSGGGGIDKGTPLHMLERRPRCAMGPCNTTAGGVDGASAADFDAMWEEVQRARTSILEEDGLESANLRGEALGSGSAKGKKARSRARGGEGVKQARA
jgi:hypothetical protein